MHIRFLYRIAVWPRRPNGLEVAYIEVGDSTVLDLVDNLLHLVVAKETKKKITDKLEPRRTNAYEPRSKDHRGVSSEA